MYVFNVAMCPGKSLSHFFIAGSVGSVIRVLLTEIDIIKSIELKVHDWDSILKSTV